MKKLEKEDLERYTKGGHLTVGDIKKWFEKNPDIPDDAPVLMERIPDVYFEKHGWGVHLKEGDGFYSCKRFNDEMIAEMTRRDLGEEPEYPKIEDPSKHIVELTDEHMTQYYPLWSCVRYGDEDGIMFIDAHY